MLTPTQHAAPPMLHSVLQVNKVIAPRQLACFVSAVT
jgi:hypothetical protein